MDKVERLRREIIELEGKRNNAELMLDNMGVPQVKLEDGFMQIWDDVERDNLDTCIRIILTRRVEIFQNQIEEKLQEARELLQ
jgi:hypothetical protein